MENSKLGFGTLTEPQGTNMQTGCAQTVAVTMLGIASCHDGGRAGESCVRFGCRNTIL